MALEKTYIKVSGFEFRYDDLFGIIERYYPKTHFKHRKLSDEVIVDNFVNYVSTHCKEILWNWVNCYISRTITSDVYIDYGRGIKSFEDTTYDNFGSVVRSKMRLLVRKVYTEDMHSGAITGITINDQVKLEKNYINEQCTSIFTELKKVFIDETPLTVLNLDDSYILRLNSKGYYTLFDLENYFLNIPSVEYTSRKFYDMLFNHLQDLYAICKYIKQ